MEDVGMKHVSLYRKWRPQAFSQVIGQERVTRTLSNAITNGKIVHAYLFSGPRGTGKTSTARILAKALNCAHGPSAVPCNECDACRAIVEGNALDVIEIDAASNRRIDEIRDLLEKIPYPPTALRYKVYIIDEVHQLTPEASSALLKMLEEPPSHVVFILATTEPHKLLPTIISRCQRFDFSLVGPEEIKNHLVKIAREEGIDIEEDALSLIAEHSRGSVRDAMSILDQVSSVAEGIITERQVAEILGEVEADFVFEMLDLLAEEDAAGALELLGQLLDGGKEPRRLIESIISYLRQIFLIQNAKRPEDIVEVTRKHMEKLKEKAKEFRPYEVIRLVERLGACHREMRQSENPRLVFEVGIVKSTSLSSDLSLEGLSYRLDQLERKLASVESGEVLPAARGSEARRKIARGKAARPAGERSAAQKGAATITESAGVDVEGSGEPERDSLEKKSPIEKESGSSPRKAWAALLSELKRGRRMKTYALLTRGRIRGVDGDRLELEFPPSASFEVEILSGSEELRAIEERLSELVGRKLSLNLSLGADRESDVGEERRATSSKGRVLREKNEVEEVPPVPPMEMKSGGEGNSKTEDIAQMLKEEFGGEIVEEEE
ncbi:MAG: DNA polymerase III subunit gamma/tau [Actinomycetota bacterium]|nr:DNA polymerase III subunit gamma/tau [Actinomycetota bacterium]